MLNACQSAMQDGSEASLAQRLVQAGVPVAVGMAYSVTVSAAVRAMPVLYERLAGGADPVGAVHAARRELFEYPTRRAYFDHDLDLADWVLPVVFRQRPVRLALREMTGEEAGRFYGRAAAVADEPRTEYGFVGRDLDIQAIERRLLAGGRPNQLLVQGMAGAGKSTLLAHLAWWWQRTGLVEHAFRFSYEDRAWTAAQILREVSATLLDKVEQAKLEALPDDAQLERVASLLRARRHLLILDNAESITASPAAIPHALAEPERQRLARLLARLRGGRTLALLGSRQAETWLAADSFGDNAYPLPGLDPQAASALVERVLARHGATRHRDDPAELGALRELVDLLGGYPLPLTVVLPALATTTPSAVLADLRAGGTGADPAGLIQQAIEYSHGRLDPATQHSLLMLAPFTATIPAGPFLGRYQELLLEQPAVAGLGGLDLPAALAQAVDVGLAAPHPGLTPFVQVQPVLPYFLRSRLADQPGLAAATGQAHYRLHAELGAYLHRLLVSHTPEERLTGQAATRACYANLTTALAHGPRTRQPINDVVRPLAEYLDQAKQQTARRQLLDGAITAFGDPDTPERQSELATLHNLAGITAGDQHRLDDAQAHLESALRLSEHFDERGAAGTYHNLGVVAQERGRWEEAEGHYRRALDIKLRFGDEHGAASTYHQLGWVAQERRRWEEAEGHYRRALETYRRFDDPRRASGTATRLGIVLAQLGRHPEAAEMLLYAAVSWREITGAWSAEALSWLKRERRELGADAFADLVRAAVPDAITADLTAAVDAADEPPPG